MKCYVCETPINRGREEFYWSHDPAFSDAPIHADCLIRLAESTDDYEGAKAIYEKADKVNTLPKE